MYGRRLMNKKYLKFADNQKINEASKLVKGDEMKKFEEYVENLAEQIRRLNHDNKPYKIVIEEKLPYGVSKNTLMSVGQLIRFLEPYPEYKIVSDSGWECSETDISVAFINHEFKHIVLTQHTDWKHDICDGWELLFDINEGGEYE